MNLQNEEQKYSYALGLSVGTNLVEQNIPEFNTEIFAQAVNTILTKQDAAMTIDEANVIIREVLSKGVNERSGENLEAGNAFLAENAKRSEVTVLESGLQYEVVTSGKGKQPSATDEVTVHYHGSLIDGRVFDSSYERKEPATFPVNGVIKGWVEALQLMKEGDKWRLAIPADLAYGTQAPGGIIEPNMALLFDVELITVK